TNIRFLLHALQQKINGNQTYSYTKEESIIKFEKLFKEYDLQKFIDNEITNLRECINFQIQTADELSSVTSKQIYDYLKYFHVMLKEIINNKEKRFPLIPQLAPKIRYIRLEARPLCDIYNNWKKTSVNVKLFEKNFRTYLDEMFTINKKYSKILKKYPTIRSIYTD